MFEEVHMGWMTDVDQNIHGYPNFNKQPARVSPRGKTRFRSIAVFHEAISGETSTKMSRKNVMNQSSYFQAKVKHMFLPAT